MLWSDELVSVDHSKFKTISNWKMTKSRDVRRIARVSNYAGKKHWVCVCDSDPTGDDNNVILVCMNQMNVIWILNSVLIYLKHFAHLTISYMIYNLRLRSASFSIQNIIRCDSVWRILVYSCDEFWRRTLNIILIQVSSVGRWQEVDSRLVVEKYKKTKQPIDSIDAIDSMVTLRNIDEWNFHS